MIYVFISILIILIIVHNLIYNCGKKERLLNKIPGPKIDFIIGNTLEVIKPTVPLFYAPRKWANTYGGIYKMKFPFDNTIFLCKPEDIEVILTSQKLLQKEKLYKFLHPWLKTGLLTSKGEKWQNRRKILTPAFHFNILKQFCKIFVEHSESLVKKLKKVEGQEVDVMPFITDFALDSICETAMGTNLDSTNKAAVDYKNAIYDLAEFIVYRLVRVWLHPKIIFDNTHTGIKQKKILKTLHNFTTNVINDRRESKAVYGNKIEVEDYVKEDGSKKRLAMLDLLLSAESEGKIDNDGIREEVDTFMFEGHDTTTWAMVYILMLLANNQDAQQLVYEEIQSVLVDDVLIDKLNDLRYLERCIKESLRLFPSVPYFGRYLTEDTQLKNYLLPAGTQCQIHVFDMHRDPNIYPNPEKFDPDRFLPENCAKRHNFAYLPFSAGPRNCIGQKFAVLEIKTMICGVLRNFKLEPVTKPDDVIFHSDFVLRTKTPIKVKFLPRN